MQISVIRCRYRIPASLMDPLYLKKKLRISKIQIKRGSLRSRFFQPIPNECKDLDIASFLVVKTRCLHEHKPISKFYMMQKSYGVNVSCK